MKKVTFTQEIKDKWIAALTSGEYKQADGYLRKEGGYCCLGVLCSVLERPLEEASNSTKHYNFISRLIGADQSQRLQDLNDGDDFQGIKRRSFKQIAHYIQAHIPVQA